MSINGNNGQPGNPLTDLLTTVLAEALKDVAKEAVHDTGKQKVAEAKETGRQKVNEARNMFGSFGNFAAGKVAEGATSIFDGLFPPVSEEEVARKEAEAKAQAVAKAQADAEALRRSKAAHPAGKSRTFENSAKDSEDSGVFIGIVKSEKAVSEEGVTISFTPAEESKTREESKAAHPSNGTVAQEGETIPFSIQEDSGKKSSVPDVEEALDKVAAIASELSPSERHALISSILTLVDSAAGGLKGEHAAWIAVLYGNPSIR